MTSPAWSLFDDPADHEAWQREEDRMERAQAAIEARDRGIEKAQRGADPLWIEEALRSVELVARSQRVLTSEDAAALMRRATHEPRAWGAVFRMAAEKGWIAPTDRFVPATHPSRHKAPIRTWMSQLFIEAAAA